MLLILYNVEMSDMLSLKQNVFTTSLYISRLFAEFSGQSGCNRLEHFAD